MIFVLHGEDINASYARLSRILESNKDFQKVNLTEKNNNEDFYLSAFSGDLLSQGKIIVCENYLQSKKIASDILKKIPRDRIIIFWEHNQLTPQEIAKIRNIASIENFKPAPLIFYFLDSLSPNREKTFSLLSKIASLSDANLIYHLENRILLLILARIGASCQIAGKITRRTILDWQWTKIKRQADLFTLQKLLPLYSGILKLDNMIKTGATNMKEDILIPFLFLKYLTG